MVTLPEDIVGLDEASKALDALISQDGAQPPPAESATDEQRAALGDEGQLPTDQSQEQTDTRADAQPPKTDEQGKTEEAKTEEAPKPKSRFEKAQERASKSWEEVNAAKAELKAEQEKLAAERAKIEQARQEWEANHREPSATEYEAHAGRLLAKAKAIEAEAEKLEDAGKYQEAEAKKREALKLTHYAEDAQAAAEQARKNPPDKAQAERQAKIEAQRKEWTLKAATDFPAFAKQNTEQAKTAAEIMRIMQQSDPDIARHPKAVYFAAELAEAKCAAARVPDLEKRLTASEARVKELEALTSPGGSGVAGQPQAPAGDDFDSLVSAARDMGNLN